MSCRTRRRGRSGRGARARLGELPDRVGELRVDERRPHLQLVLRPEAEGDPVAAHADVPRVSVVTPCVRDVFA